MNRVVTLKGVTLSERVRHRVALFVEDFREDQKIVEEKYFTLMGPCFLLLVGVGNFVEATVAYEATMGHGQVLTK